MEISTFDIDGPALLTPKIHSDARGHFMETFRRDVFEGATGGTDGFVQDNYSVSAKTGTLRGLHLQNPPSAQGKLVRCVKGEILDVIVDVRRASKTYGEHLRVPLSYKSGVQLWVPTGFLHGFITLTEDAHVSYKCTAYYNAEAEQTVAWNDADLAIKWGVKTPILSPKDQAGQSFANFQTPF